MGQRRREGVWFCVENKADRAFEAAELESVFEPFYRKDKEYSREQGSAGLGLSICRKIVTEHGGRIWAENAPDSRVRFFVCFPEKEDQDES